MKPNIKRFRTKTNFYVYDVNTNHIVEVSSPVYELLQSPDNADLEHTKDEILKSKSEIAQAVEEGFFSTHRPQRISHGITSCDIAKKLIEKKMENLVLEITNQCNNSCAYCGVHKELNQKEMEFETAKKAIDYFLENSLDSKVPKLAFYGGEPLLQFELLTKCVEYFKQNTDKAPYFSLTTNGTLLNEENIEFLIENEFNLMISLDGPPEIHNRYRKFADGTGTYSDVMEGLEKIKKVNEDYFYTHITTNSVLSPPFEFEKINDFFNSNLLFRQKNRAGIRHMYELVKGEENEFFKKIGFTKKETENLRIILMELNSKYKDSIIREKTSELVIEESLFKDRYTHIARRKLSKMKSQCMPYGNCLIGKHKLFVSPDGKYYACEKVMHNCCIGDVDRGIDFNRVFELYKSFDDHFRHCKDCWAIRLCKKCFADVSVGDRISKERVDNICRFNLDRIEQDLINYTEIIEANPDAFKKYEERRNEFGMQN